jgi:hypothetical protein
MIPTATHKAAAVGLFRSSVFFIFAVGAFAERDQHTSTLLATGVFLLDVASWNLSQVLTISANEAYNRAWFNTLADRFIFEKLLDRFRNQEHVDFQEIVKEGTVAAREDVQLSLRDNTVWAEWRWFKKSLAGVGYYLWFWISYGILRHSRYAREHSQGQLKIAPAALSRAV